MLAGPPLEESGVARVGVEAHLLAVGLRGGCHEDVEIVQARRTEPAPRRLGRLLEHVDGLARAVVERLGEDVARRLPELRDGALLADEHARLAARHQLGEGGGAGAGRHEVGAEVAEPGEAFPVPQGCEPSESAPRDVLEEDALDRLLGAELEDLREPRPLDQPRHARGR